MGGLGWVLVLASWVGLGWVKKNGPTSISETASARFFTRFERKPSAVNGTIFGGLDILFVVQSTLSKH